MRPEFIRRREKEPKVEETVPVVCASLTESMGATQLFSLSESDRKQFSKQLAFPLVKLITQPESQPLSLLNSYVDPSQRADDQLLERRFTVPTRQKLLQQYPSNRFQPTEYSPDENRRLRAVNKLAELSFQQVLHALANESQRRVAVGSPVREDLVRTFRLRLLERILDARLATLPIQSVSDFPLPEVHLTEDMNHYVNEIRFLRHK